MNKKEEIEQFVKSIGRVSLILTIITVVLSFILIISGEYEDPIISSILVLVSGFITISASYELRKFIAPIRNMVILLLTLVISVVLAIALYDGEHIGISLTTLIMIIYLIRGLVAMRKYHKLANGSDII